MHSTLPPHSTRVPHRRTAHLTSLRRHTRGGWLGRLLAPRYEERRRRSSRFVHRDYVKKTFVNPYFNASTPRRTKAKKIKISIMLLACAGILALFLYHPFFDVTSISIQGNQKITATDIQQTAEAVLKQKKFFIFKEKNFFVLNTNAIADALNARYAFESLRVSKSAFSTLTIMVVERGAAATVKNGSDISYIDKNGTLIGPAHETDALYAQLPQILLNTPRPSNQKDTVIAPATLKSITTLCTLIPDRTGIVLKAAEPQDEEGRIVHLITEEGWQIYVDRQNDWNKQVTLLKNILNVKFKDNNRTGLHYIDVRYENRVYIK